MKSDQDLYKQLRDLPKEQLWSVEAARFDGASPRERMERVAVIRAVGSIFSRFGTEEEKDAVRAWLLGLLNDPQEKIRRYAAAALPKIGAGTGGEESLLNLLQQSGEEREKRHLGRALEKIGGSATLASLGQGVELAPLTEQKVKAAVLRKENPGAVRLEAQLPADPELQILLRCRRGLEKLVCEEAKELLLSGISAGVFRLAGVSPGCVTLTAEKPFSLAMLYRIRGFATVGLQLGVIREDDDWVESLAGLITAPRTRTILKAATEGAARYRLELSGLGHRRGTIRQVVERAYALAPEIVNDARQAPWSVDVIPGPGKTASVELRPRLYPDPRLTYRQDDVAAASHPPLAACMARLAQKGAKGVDQKPERIWDPFCGSGLELIERTLLGGVSVAYGTDLDAAALSVAQANFAAAQLEATRAEFTCCDFRDAGKTTAIEPGSLSLVITNPPLGRRVRIKDMQGLFASLYEAAAWSLQPGGLLVFVNPLRTEPSPAAFRLEYRESVDLGGFACRLEMYRKKSG